MREFLDPFCEEYQFGWQSKFSRKRKKGGPARAIHAQRYVSRLRVMRRRLLRGAKPSFSDFRTFGKTHRGEFVEKRRSERFLRAIKRGETTETMVRRGLLMRLGT